MLIAGFVSFTAIASAAQNMQGTCFLWPSHTCNVQGNITLAVIGQVNQSYSSSAAERGSDTAAARSSGAGPSGRPAYVSRKEKRDGFCLYIAPKGNVNPHYSMMLYHVCPGHHMQIAQGVCVNALRTNLVVSAPRSLRRQQSEP